ncbi:SirB1 family protein [Pseudomonas sp. LRF_L74]|uniref:SirB1 family protein n=1 Tax=Pseudomonas sp. LRF_L74 TaxID=3369422 RepID=UPI003F5D7A47
MTSRPTWLTCLEHSPEQLFEAALWIAAEHDILLKPGLLVDELANLRQQVLVGLPCLPAGELAQPLIRRLGDLGFHEDDEMPLRPQAALLHRVMQRRRGQPLSLALIALELARQLNIPLEAVNFPGRLLLRSPGADHLLDSCTGRRLYPRDCRELLARVAGPDTPLQASHMQACNARALLLRLSRNLCQLHTSNDDPLAALKDAERILLLAPPNAADHLTRAALYHELDCPQAERFDLEHALMLSDDPRERVRIAQHLAKLEKAGTLSLH